MRKSMMLALAAVLGLAGALRADEAAKAAAAEEKPATEAKVEAAPAATPVAKNDAPGSLAPGKALMDEEKWAEAAAYFEGIGEQTTANGMKKREHWRLNNLAVSLLNSEKYDEAIAAAEKALAIKPDLASAHNTIAAAKAKSGKRDEAIAALEKSIAELKAKNADTSKLESNLVALKEAAELSKPKKQREAEAKAKAEAEKKAAEEASKSEAAPAAAPAGDHK